MLPMCLSATAIPTSAERKLLATDIDSHWTSGPPVRA
jgi:hypothetical protein